ncbi:MAG: hypothetical protein JW841_15295 [Deltaproteobacteria bacterium]|nr:hypothetical protein [Deltaproteobacteria bacterium]
MTIKTNPSPLAIDIGNTSQISVVAIPITTVELNVISNEVTKVTTPIAIKGKTTGFGVNKVEAVFSWIVDRDNDDVKEYTYKGEMTIASNGDFEFKVDNKSPELSVFYHRLFGGGNVGYSITPTYPYAPMAIVPPKSSKITFENTLKIESSVKSPSGMPVGMRTEFKLEYGPLTKELLKGGDKVVLFWQEDDSDKDEHKNNRDFAASVDCGNDHSKAR